jgi:hypothetical protein
MLKEQAGALRLGSKASSLIDGCLPARAPCRFLEHYQSSISYQQLKAYRAILRCRTSALGGHIDVCHGCGFETGVPYNSCRSRRYPKFQAHARQRWIEAWRRDLLPTNYFELPAESRATDEPHNQHNHNNCSYQTQT